MAVISRRNRPNYTDDTLKSIADHVVRTTQTVKEGGLRLRWGNVDDAETSELVELTREAEQGGEGFRLDRLSKRKRGRWEALVAKGAGQPESFFEDARKVDEIRSLVAETTRRSVRRPIKRQEEVGLLGVLGQQVIGGYLHAEHVSLATIILIQLDTGVAFAPRARIERVDDEPVLVIDSGFGVVGGDRDPNGTFATFQPTLRHLEKNGYFVVGRSGRDWQISLGWRAKAAMAITTAKKKAKAA